LTAKIDLSLVTHAAHAAWEICLASVQVQWYAVKEPWRASQFSLQTNKKYAPVFRLMGCWLADDCRA
jgi:hypothetical protein